MSDDLTRLREIAAAATPGPWETEHEVVTGGTEQPDPCWLISSEAAKFGYIGEFFSESNAYFIATFDPPTVTALIERAERAERERDELRDSIRQLHQASPGILWSGLICVACSDEDCEVMYPCPSAALVPDEGDNQ